MASGVFDPNDPALTRWTANHSMTNHKIESDFRNLRPKRLAAPLVPTKQRMHRCAKKLSGLLCGTFYGTRVVLYSPPEDHGGLVWSEVELLDRMDRGRSRSENLSRCILAESKGSSGRRCLARSPVALAERDPDLALSDWRYAPHITPYRGWPNSLDRSERFLGVAWRRVRAHTPKSPTWIIQLCTIWLIVDWPYLGLRVASRVPRVGS